MLGYHNFPPTSALDRAVVVTRAIAQILATGGGEAAVTAYLRDEFFDIAQTAICEFRLVETDESPAARRQ